MRARLTLAFVLLALVVIAVLVASRAITITERATADLRAQLDREAQLVATVVAAGGAGELPDQADLAAYAAPDRRIVVSLADGRNVEAAGAGWDGRDDVVGGAASVDGVMAQVLTSDEGVDRAVAAALPSLFVVGTALVLLAAVAGVLLARRLSRPFIMLADAADALARGRSDLELPRTRIREARAIGVALEGAARQLGDSLRRERDLALRASHELRTPLTGLRLELDDLRHRDDVPADLKDTADRALARTDQLDRAVGEVVEESRSHPVVRGAELPLALVATALAQRWAETLSLAGVASDVELVGDATVTLTPGPLEQLLDEVLLEVLAHRGERVRLVLDGGERHLRVTVTVTGATAPGPGGARSQPLERARALVETLGGRVSGSLTAAGGLVVLVPRR